MADLSRHTYSARVVNGGDLELLGGTIGMDASSSPHVRGAITIALPEWSVLTDLDPKNTPRVMIEVDADVNGVAQTRSFNLGVRSRGVPQEAGTVSLSLASDEALLIDYRPRADDDTPFGLATSLRDVVEYVLGVAIPGAALASGPDPDVHPTWEVTNMHTNPEIVNAYGFGLGTGSTGVARVVFGSVAAIEWTATMSDSVLVVSPEWDTFRVSQGRYYVFTIELLNGDVPRLAQLGIQWYGGDELTPMMTYYGPAQMANMVTWTSYHIIARAPVGASSMVPLVFTYGNVPGEQNYAKRPMVYEGTRVVAPFSGEYPDDADYEYAWAESAHGSPSLRIPLNDTPDPDAFLWDAGQTAMDMLNPIVQAAGLRLVCDESRVWSLRDETYTAAGSLAVEYGENMIAGDDSISRDGRWGDAAVTEYKWTPRGGIEQRMIDSYESVANPTRVLYFQKDTAYPGPGFSEYVVRRAAQLGRETSGTVVADWTARAEQPIVVTPYGTPEEEGKTQSVSFNFDNDEMTVTTRTDD